MTEGLSAAPPRAADMAAVLLDLADQAGVDRVSRAAIREAWIGDDPTAARARPIADPRARGRQRGDHRRATKGSAAKAQTQKALAWLERHSGAVRRDGDDVELLDRAALERLAET